MVWYFTTAAPLQNKDAPHRSARPTTATTISPRGTERRHYHTTEEKGMSKDLNWLVFFPQGCDVQLPYAWNGVMDKKEAKPLRTNFHRQLDYTIPRYWWTVDSGLMATLQSTIAHTGT